MTRNDRRRGSRAPEGHASDVRLESVVAALERVRDAGASLALPDTRTRLTYAAELLGILERLVPELQRTTPQAESDGVEAMITRVTVDLYDRAARELRAAADEARGCCDRADTILADVRAEARRRQRHARRVAEKRDRPPSGPAGG